MGPVEAFTTAWRKSFTYGGKATRVEYWWFYLMNLIVALVILALAAIAGKSEVSSLLWIYWLAQVFPSLSIMVRRLRDIGKKWTWIFINLVPFIGGFWFIYLLCQPSGRFEMSQASNL
tara:strand:- start:42 stop:395 length:354 start_codon:yes stop_codon:yes gene_type:complete